MRVMSARAPGELISSSPLISTVSVPYSLNFIACSIDTMCVMTAAAYFPKLAASLARRSTIAISSRRRMAFAGPAIVEERESTAIIGLAGAAGSTRSTIWWWNCRGQL